MGGDARYRRPYQGSDTHGINNSVIAVGLQANYYIIIYLYMVIYMRGRGQI